MKKTLTVMSLTTIFLITGCFGGIPIAKVTKDGKYKLNAAELGARATNGGLWGVAGTAVGCAAGNCGAGAALGLYGGVVTDPREESGGQSTHTTTVIDANGNVVSSETVIESHTESGDDVRRGGLLGTCKYGEYPRHIGGGCRFKQDAY